MKSVRVVVKSDLKLARQATKDRSVAQAVLERLSPKLRRAVRILAKNPQDVDDLLNKTLLAVLENLNKFKGKSSLEAWAGKIAFNTVVRHNQRQRMIDGIMTPDPMAAAGADFADPEQETARRQLRDQLIGVLRKLPAERRNTMVLRLVFGHSVAEIAQLTEVPKNTVRGRIRTGLKELREGLARERDLLVAR